MSYKVADISLAAYGRREIELAEREMPGYVETAVLATSSSSVAVV